MTDQEYIKQAREQYGREGEIELDEDAIVSRGDDDGAYVGAWVFVHNKSGTPDCPQELASKDEPDKHAGMDKFQVQMQEMMHPLILKARETAHNCRSDTFEGTILYDQLLEMEGQIDKAIDYYIENIPACDRQSIRNMRQRDISSNQVEKQEVPVVKLNKQRYEYLFIEGPLPTPTPYGDGFTEADLSFVGKNGWRMVQFAPRPGGRYSAVMEREVTDLR